LELKSLHYLNIAYTNEREVDCSYLLNNVDLKFLSFDASKNLKSLSSLKHLYSLDTGQSKLSDMNIFKDFPNISKLRISQTNITDIRPIKYLSKVSSLSMNFTNNLIIPVEKIHLKELKVRNSNVKTEDIEKFKALNPECNLSYSMDVELQDALKEIDYIRVRTGGTCHRNPDEEETIFVIKQKDKIKEFVSHLRIEEEQTFHCQCCGSPSFELYKNGTLKETIGFHHGHSIRWHNKPFGDAVLTEKSIDYICKLLFDNGIKEHYIQLLKDKEMDKIASSKFDISFDELPKGLQSKINEAKRFIDIVPVYINWEKDHKKRAILALRYLGAHQGSVDYTSTMDRMAFYVLNNEKSEYYKINEDDKISVDTILEVINENQENQKIMRGAIKWFLNFYDYKSFSKKQLKKAVNLITSEALSHPRLSTRVKAMYVLKEINTYWSIHYLRNVIGKKYKIKQLTEVQLEPRWWKNGGLQLLSLDEACSDIHYAAVYLSEVKDPASLDSIKNLHLQETNKDLKKVFQEALENYSAF